MSSSHAGPHMTRYNVDRLIASDPTSHTLRCRANAVQKLAEDIAHFSPWPALQQSLLADATMLRARAKSIR